jgi:hypothetical protein
MLARCVFSQGSELGAPVRGGMWSEASVFSGVVTPEREYHVQGMGLFNSVLLLLIQGDEGRPDWLPAALFSVELENVPADWQFALVDAGAAGGASEPEGWQGFGAIQSWWGIHGISMP